MATTRSFSHPKRKQYVLHNQIYVPSCDCVHSSVKSLHICSTICKWLVLPKLSLCDCYAHIRLPFPPILKNNKKERRFPPFPIEGCLRVPSTSYLPLSLIKIGICLSTAFFRLFLSPTYQCEWKECSTDRKRRYNRWSGCRVRGRLLCGDGHGLNELWRKVFIYASDGWFYFYLWSDENTGETRQKRGFVLL